MLDIEKYVFGHHQTHDSLERSIDQNCVLCNEVTSLMLDLLRLETAPGVTHVFVFKDDELDFAPPDDGYFTAFRFTVNDEQLSIHLSCSGTEKEYTSVFVPLKGEQDSEGLTLKLDDSTNGLQGRKLIGDWDKNCLAEHLQCGRVRNSAFLPTRVLEINDVSNPTTCRLLLREEVPEDSRYTALSYCWGAVATRGRLCLLQSTFDTMRTGLALGFFPKTYVDAIYVTARLGVRYVWIDALCIIQDSQDDWRSEASTMQAVYRNSYLTISAVAGAHDNSGLFYSRDPVKVQPTVVNIAYSSYDKPKSFRHEYETRAAETSWRVGSVTTKRGWCLQERILPSRVLHFGAQQIFWECYEQHASETSPKTIYANLPSPLSSPQCTGLWKRLIGELSLPDIEDPYENLLSEWYATLSAYTSCQLTHASDKLVAISGLANDMRSALDSCQPAKHHTYLAGLWSEDLRFGLCWVLREMGKRPHIYRAPSWSFTSVDGSTSWDSIPMREKLTWYVSGLECTAVTRYMDDIDTGEVTGGQLELRGYWTVVRTVAERTIGDPLNARRLAHFRYPDLSSAFETPLAVEANASIFYDTEDDMMGQAFCVPMYARWNHGPRWSFRGIVLTPVEGQRMSYRRIGLLEGFF